MRHRCLLQLSCLGREVFFFSFFCLFFASASALFFLLICFPKSPFRAAQVIASSLCLGKPSGRRHPSATLDPGSIFKGSMGLLRSLQCLLAYRASSYRLPAPGGFVSLLPPSRGYRLATAARTRSVPWRRGELPILTG